MTQAATWRNVLCTITENENLESSSVVAWEWEVTDCKGMRGGWMTQGSGEDPYYFHRPDDCFTVMQICPTFHMHCKYVCGSCT